MAEEYEQLELTEQGQGISSPPPSERQVRASGGEHSLLPNTRVTMDTKTSLQPDVFAARALQEAARDGREDLLDDLLEYFTEDQIDINALDKEGFAALHKAVMYHRVDIIKKLLAAKCDPDVLTKDGLTPLHIAACYLPRGNGTVTETEGASRQVIKLLLESKGKSAERRLKACDAQFWHTPLHMACSRANVPAVRELLEHIQRVDLSIVNAQDWQKDTPLHEACIRGNLFIVKELLKHGADVNAQNDDGKNPLQIACKGGYAEVVKAILDYNCEGAKELAEAPVEGSLNTAMHLAVENRDIAMVEALLAYEVNPSMSNYDKVAPIHIAAGQGYTDIARVLLDRDGSCLNLCDNQSRSPLHYATRNNQVEMIELLISQGCNKELSDGNSVSPLLLSAKLGKTKAAKALIIGGCDMNTTDKDDRSAVYWAAQEGHTDVLRNLLKNKEGILLVHVVEPSHRNTPFHIAAKMGRAEAIKLLALGERLQQLLHQLSVEREALSENDPRATERLQTLEQERVEMEVLRLKVEHLDFRNDANRTPLHLAAMSGNMEVVRLLFHKYSPSLTVKDNEGNTPFHLAVVSGNMEVVRFLVDKYPPFLTGKDKAGFTPLHLAAKYGKTEVADVLIREGAKVDARWDAKYKISGPSENDPRATERRQTLEQERVEMEVLRLKVEHLDFKNDEHKTPLHLAAMSGNMEVVRLLFHKYSPSLTVKDNEGNTPFHLAVVSGNMEIVRFLVDKYPPFLTGKNKAGFTPLHLAAKYGKTEVADVLIREGAKVDARWDANSDASGSSPIHLAVENGHAEVIALLIKADASLGAVDTWNRTPLHLAVMKGYADIISLLTAAGAPLEAKDFDGDLQMTPLHRAVVINHAEIISLLIDAGAQLEAKDNWERTPLFLACSIGHLPAAEVLIHKGADVTAHVLTLDMINTRNCLELAVKKGHKDIALAIIQSDQWKAALRHSNDQMTPFRRMIQQIPSVAQAVLNRCMEVNYEFDEATIFKVKVGFNYEFLDDYRDEPSRELESHTERTASNSSSENTENENKWGPEFSAKNHPLALMVKYKRDDLLKHPVVTSLLEYKWRTYGGAVFLFNLITYLIFLFFLTLYALLLPHPDHRFCHDFSVTQSVASLPVNGTVCPFESAVANYSRVLNIDPTVPMNSHANVALYFAAVVVIISVLGRLLLELSQLVLMRHRYFLKIENYIELLAYISAIIFVSHFGTNCWCPTNWQWQLGAFGVFLAWINLILFLKRVPLLGIYVLMFNAILHTFLKFALIAFLFVVAFGIGFYMILYKALDEATLIVNVSPFRNAGLSFIKTMVMALGELDYDNIFGHNNESRNLLTSFPEVAYILWIVFLIVMPILLTNLLVGLAVGDIKDVQDQAQLKSNLLQIEADELLPACIRRKFKRQRQIIYPHQRGWNLWWRKFMKKVWGAEYCNSINTIMKHHEVSTIEQVQSQTEQLSKEVEKLQTEMTVQLSREVGKLQKAMSPIEQVQTQTEQLSRQVNKLQTEISPIEQVQAQTEQLSREVKNLQIELMEKNNRMEQVLMMMAKKQGIQWDPEEAEK